MSTSPPTSPSAPGPERGPDRHRPNFALRRSIAGALALMVVVAIVVVVVALAGGGSSTTATPTTTTVVEVTTTTTAPPTTTTLAYPRHNDLAAPPAFEPRDPPVRVVSDTAPLTVWVVGDSTAQSLGQLLENDVLDLATIEPRTVSKNSSGLSRQDFYDWPAALAGLLAEGAPDAVVISMGDNDAQALQPLGSDVFVEVGTPDWVAEYTRRLAAFVDQVTAAGSRVYLVGRPAMRDPGFDERIAVVDEAYRTVAATDPEITYIDSRALLSDDAGGYTDSLPNGDGEAVQVRNDDGVHLSLEGARWLSKVVARVVAADYGLQAP